MVRIDPELFRQAADNFDAISTQAFTFGASARGTLNGYDGMAGTDPGGEQFAEAYDQMAAAALQGFYDTGVSARGLDRGLMACAGTHAQANANAGHIVYDAASVYVLRPQHQDMTVAPPPSAFGGRADTMVEGLDSAAVWVWDQILNLVGMLFPDGDPEKLRDAGKSWVTVLGDLRSLSTSISSADAPLSGLESGEIPSIQTKTDDFSEGLKAFIADEDGIGKIDDICREYADSIEETHRETRQMLMQLVIEIAASAAIGGLLSVVTFGASAVVAGSAIAIRIGNVAVRIGMLVQKCVAAAMRLSSKLRAIVNALQAAGRNFPKLTRVTIELVSSAGGATAAELADPNPNFFAAMTGGFAGGGITSVIAAPFGSAGSRVLVKMLADAGGGAGGTAVDLAIRGDEITPMALALGAGLGVVMSAKFPSRKGPDSTVVDGHVESPDVQAPTGAGGNANGPSIDGNGVKTEFEGPAGAGNDISSAGGDGDGAPQDHGDAPPETDIHVTPETNDAATGGTGAQDSTPATPAEPPAQPELDVQPEQAPAADSTPETPSSTDQNGASSSDGSSQTSQEAEADGPAAGDQGAPQGSGVGATRGPDSDVDPDVDDVSPQGDEPEQSVDDGADAAGPEGDAPTDVDADAPAGASPNPSVASLYGADGQRLTFAEWDAATNGDGSLNQRKGEFGELHAQDYMESQGWQRIDDGADGSHDPMMPGVDGIYSRTDADGATEFAVIEAKYNTSRLGQTIDGRQMSQSWLAGDVTGNNRLAGGLRGADAHTQLAVRDAFERGDLRSGVVRVSPNGDVHVRQLDADGYIVRGTDDAFESRVTDAGDAPSTPDAAAKAPLGNVSVDLAPADGATSSLVDGAHPAPDSTGTDSTGTDSTGTDSTDAGATDADGTAPVVGTELSRAEIDRLAGDGYHVAFFDGVSHNSYYTSPAPAIGAPGGKFWVMPLADGAHVANASDAYRATGASPGATRAYTGMHLDALGNPDPNNPVAPADRGLYALVFQPDAANPPVKPTTADANGWPHFLESDDPSAGHTAVLTGDGPNAGYLTNPHIREFVIDGGDLIGPGSYIVRIEDGAWITHRVF